MNECATYALLYICSMNECTTYALLYTPKHISHASAAVNMQVTVSLFDTRPMTT
jgi:hypothetical protein